MQQFKQSVSNARAANLARRSAGGHRKSAGPEVSGDAFEDGVLCAPIEKIRVRPTNYVTVFFARGLIEDDESIRLRVGKWSQQDAVRETEDRSVGADAERERQHDDDRERVTLRQDASAVGNVAHEVVDQANAARAATLFLRLIDTTETSQRRVTRVFRRHAAFHVLLGISFEVKAQLFVELLVQLVFASERAPAT